MSASNQRRYHWPDVQVKIPGAIYVRGTMETMRLLFPLLLALTACKVHVGERPKVLGKTGDELTREAEVATRSGDWVTAGILLSPVSKLMPADPLGSTYRADAEYVHREVAKHLKSDLPMHVATDPPVDVYSFTGAVVASEQELFAKINYVHPRSVPNGPELRPLAEQLHAKLVAQFPGLRTQFKHVVYSGFQEPPVDPTRTYERFGTIINTATGRAEAGKE
jgi:hypothetical protein